MNDRDKMHGADTEEIKRQYKKATGHDYKRPTVDEDLKRPMQAREVIFSLICLLIALLVYSCS